MTDQKKPEAISDDDLDAVQGGARDFGDDGILRTAGRTDVKTTQQDGDKLLSFGNDSSTLKDVPGEKIIAGSGSGGI